MFELVLEKMSTKSVSSFLDLAVGEKFIVVEQPDGCFGMVRSKRSTNVLDSDSWHHCVYMKVNPSRFCDDTDPDMPHSGFNAIQVDSSKWAWLSSGILVLRVLV